MNPELRPHRNHQWSAAPRPRVIVVEDDEDTLVGMEMCLENAGYDVTGLQDGVTFVDCVSRALLLENGPRPDAIVTDIRLPWMSGLSVVRALRRAGWDVPVFVISGLERDEVTRLVHPTDRVEFFSKPLDMTLLLRSLRQAVPVHPR